MSPYCKICGEWMGPGKGSDPALPEPSAPVPEAVAEPEEIAEAKVTKPVPAAKPRAKAKTTSAAELKKRAHRTV